ncbi:hypothetical protein F4801DRAFT_604801 [Xylaria longipes]|nr:hypothetical protein F4801DRAFT_604801 [Xylaria longipes]
MAGSLFGAPASPWTERYGIDGNTVFSLTKEDDGLLHSGLAPLNPRLHPQYYDSVPPADEFTIPTSDEEIDKILIAEEYQRSSFFGNPSWCIPPLHSVLSWDGNLGILGGHRPGDDQRYDELLQDYMKYRIEVDESTWLPFFRKDRWYNSVQEFEDTIVDADGTTWQTRTWSVDDDRVWNVVRFSIEIANRILKTLIRDNNRWLGAFLYGRIQLWYELHSNPADYHQYIGNRDYRILMDPDAERKICDQMGKPFLGRDIEPDEQRRSDLVADLLKSMAWGFIPSTDTSRGVTSAFFNGSVLQAICRINPNLVKLLCGGTISVAERCTLHMRQAMTLMHALFRARIEDGRNLSPQVLDEKAHGSLNQRFREAYIGDEPIRESGRSFESAIWGGTPVDGPLPRGGRYAPNIPMLVTSVVYPSPHAVPKAGTDMENHPSLKPGAPIALSFLPAALFWRLQSKNFWNSTPPSGQNGFLFPRLFTTRVLTERHTFRDIYRRTTVNPDAADGIHFGDMARRWNERLSIWAARRPWYDSALRTWLRTPWGYMAIRENIKMFIGAYKARDEAECAKVAWDLEQEIPRASFERSAIFRVAGDFATSIPEIGSTTNNPPSWLFYCLSLLMFAALPLRRADHVPAKAAMTPVYLPRSQTVGGQYPPLIAVKERAEGAKTIARRNLYYSRLSNARPITVNNRNEFIAEALRIINYFGRTRRVHIHDAFFTELHHLASYIRRQLRTPGFHEGSWLQRFPFEIPEYDPSTFVRWDPDTGSWEDEYK